MTISIPRPPGRGRGGGSRERCVRARKRNETGHDCIMFIRYDSDTGIFDEIKSPSARTGYPSRFRLRHVNAILGRPKIAGPTSRSLRHPLAHLRVAHSGGATAPLRNPPRLTGAACPTTKHIKPGCINIYKIVSADGGCL